MARPAIRRLLKILAWSAAGLSVLILAGVAYTLYVVYSFDTVTLPARYGEVDAELVSPAGPPRPLIVGLGGAEGGNIWLNPRLGKQRQRFVDAGYAFLAVGYFGTPNSPVKLDRISLEGISAAIARAQTDPRVSHTCVILLGGSKGAELSLALASHDSNISAVIALAPGDTVFPAHTDAMTTSSWALNGKGLAFAPVPWSATFDLVRGDLRSVMQRILDGDTAAAAAIAVENISGPILLVAGDQDEMWPSLEMSRRMIKRLDEHGFAHTRDLKTIHGDHASPIDHFELVEDFLQHEVATLPQCSTAASQVNGSPH